MYCLALVPSNTLPKTPLGGIHLSETKQLFQDGALHPCNVLMCPHSCVTNLPKPRQKQPGKHHFCLCSSFIYAHVILRVWTVCTECCMFVFSPDRVPVALSERPVLESLCTLQSEKIVFFLMTKLGQTELFTCMASK